MGAENSSNKRRVKAAEGECGAWYRPSTGGLAHVHQDKFLDGLRPEVGGEEPPDDYVEPTTEEVVGMYSGDHLLHVEDIRVDTAFGGERSSGAGEQKPVMDGKLVCGEGCGTGSTYRPRRV